MAEIIKRSLDILLAIVGIVLTLPFLPIIALLIKLDSKGPVFYLCDRVGKDMRLFKMYKFRTMLDTPVEVGESVSPKYDPRVSSLGRVLRRTKINEVPQFINILKGEMSFVGPRPEAPDLAEHYPEEARRIFSVKPGLVGPNQIAAFNEEELYPPGVNEKDYYFSHIVPWKTVADLDYIDNPNLLKDIQFIVVAVLKTVAGLVKSSDAVRDWVSLTVVFSDLLLVASCVFLDGLGPGRIWATGSAWVGLTYIPLVLGLRISCLWLFGVYGTLVEHTSHRDVLNVAGAVITGALLTVPIDFFYGLRIAPVSLAVGAAALVASLSAVRFGIKHHLGRGRAQHNGVKPRRVMIYPADRTGALAHRTLELLEEHSCRIVGFLDDAPEKYGKKLHGLKVMGNRYNIAALARLHDIDEVIISDSDISGEDLSDVVGICRDAGLAYQLFSPARETSSQPASGLPFRNVGLADTLSLQPISMDREAVGRLVRNKTVLLHGSGGALGLELCRRLLELRCARLIVVDRYESYLAESSMILRNLFPRDRIVPLLLASENAHALEGVFAKYRPDIVFHMTLKKHTPLLDANREEIAASNWNRTFQLASLAVESGSEIFYALSSFAANDCTNFLSKSLRVAELSLQQLFSDTRTRLVIGRLCDVAENRGGVVSIIQKQIRHLGSVTLPGPDAKTHLLSKGSGAEFMLQTLVESSASPQGNGIFVCDPGPPIPLTEVVRRVAELHGLKSDTQIPITYLDEAGYHSPTLEFGIQKLQGTGRPGINFLPEDSNAFLNTRESFPQELRQLHMYSGQNELKIEDFAQYLHPATVDHLVPANGNGGEHSRSQSPCNAGSPR